jgi:hypothetical protein
MPAWRSGKETQLLSILLRQANDALHLLVVHAKLPAKLLDHCDNINIAGPMSADARL